MRQSVEKGHGNQSRIRSYFKFIPKQIETYVEADWSPRYVVNSGLLTKIKEFEDARQGRNMAGTYLLAMIILFLYKFKTASLVGIVF